MEYSHHSDGAGARTHGEGAEAGGEHAVGGGGIRQVTPGSSTGYWPSAHAHSSPATASAAVIRTARNACHHSSASEATPATTDRMTSPMPGRW